MKLTVSRAIVFLSMSVMMTLTNAYAQDSIPAYFKYNTQTRKWETSTEVVKQYIIELKQKVYRDSIMSELEKQVKILERVVDSQKVAITSLDDAFDYSEEKNRLKDRVIEQLTKPVELKVKQEKPPWIEPIGLYPFLGAMYDFAQKKLESFTFSTLKYYGGVKWVWKVFDKLLTDLRVEYPPAVKLELGIKF
jgi:hypothetical protein